MAFGNGGTESPEELQEKADINTLVLKLIPLLSKVPQKIRMEAIEKALLALK